MEMFSNISVSIAVGILLVTSTTLYAPDFLQFLPASDCVRKQRQPMI